MALIPSSVNQDFIERCCGYWYKTKAYIPAPTLEMGRIQTQEFDAITYLIVVSTGGDETELLNDHADTARFLNGFN